MATSGSWNHSLTAATLITRAAQRLGILYSGETIASADETLLLGVLQDVAKQNQGNSDFSMGLKPYHRQRVTLFLASGQQKYLIGPASTDARSTTAPGRTTISANEAAAQTVLSITATTDTTSDPGTTITMTASDIIGIEQNDGTIFWTTISSTGAGPVVTVGTGLDVAADAGKYVWWFTSRAQRFPVIESAVLRDENRQDSPLEIYRDALAYDVGVADKYANGDPTSILVEPLVLNTRIILDTQPTDVTKQIVLTVQYPAEDYDATANDLAFPQEYYLYLIWEVVKQACPIYQKPWTPIMQDNWQRAKATALALNPEVSDMYFQPGL